MAKATWSGSIQFSMISIPIKMYTATESSKKLKFNLLNPKTGNRIKKKNVDAETGEDVAYADLVKGYEIEKGKYVLVDPNELDELSPDKTSAIEIVGFMSHDAIDPIFYNKPYYINAQEGAEKPYALFARALEDSSRVAVGRYVDRTREKLVMIRAVDGGLVASTLHWHDQLRDPNAFRPDVEKVELSEAEVKMATELIETMTGSVAFEELVDTYRERVLKLIQAKAEGKELVASDAPSAEGPSEDLFAALEASLDEAKKQIDEQKKAQ